MDVVQGMWPEQAALPALLRTLALLPLGRAEVEAAVERAVAGNPALQRRGVRACPGCGFPGVSGRCGRCSPARTGGGWEVGDDPFDGIEVAAGCEVAAVARAALDVVLDHLTPRGLLDADPDDIAAAHGLDPAHVREAVRAVVAAGPPGVASRTVGELLAAQALALGAGSGGVGGWVVPLLRDHLDWVAAADAAAVAGRFGTTVAEAERAFAWVRARLRPDAGVRRAGRAAAVPVPDVFVDRDAAGDLVVRVPGAADLGLSVVPADPALRGHPEARAWMHGHEVAGQELIRQLDARAGALARVAGEVVLRQRRWFEAGAAGQVDLTRADVAAAVGVHPSTVSRAVAGKSLRRPDGRVVELAVLFGTGAAVRARLAELLAARPGDRPSDARLAELLAADGMPVARRTVAKYRAQLPQDHRVKVVLPAKRG